MKFFLPLIATTLLMVSSTPVIQDKPSSGSTLMSLKSVTPDEGEQGPTASSKSKPSSSRTPFERPGTIRNHEDAAIKALEGNGAKVIPKGYRRTPFH